MNRIIDFLFRRNTQFPKKIKGHWYCGSWYLYLSDLRDKGEYQGSNLNPDEIKLPAENEVAFNHFRTGLSRNDTSWLVDGLIPAIRINDRIGLYRQIGSRYRTSSFYDGAPWDDGYHIDLKFVKSVLVNSLD